MKRIAHARIIVLMVVPLGVTAAAQERAWVRVGGGDAWNTVDTFGDFNGDGAIDVLAGVNWNYGTLNMGFGCRILSGIDGTTLVQIPGGGGRDAGDMDNDGLRDYATVSNGPGIGQQTLELLSRATGQVLWSASGPYPYFASSSSGDYSLMAGNLDLDGDGRPDFVAINIRHSDSTVFAFDNSGALQFSIPLFPYGWIANTVCAMPDLDGDGGAEFLVGCIEPSGHGAVLVVLGRTGTVGRISYGLSVGDYLGGAVCNAGDVDQDGIADYAAASYWSAPRSSLVIFSGRTGAVLRDLGAFGTDSGGMVGDVDVDQDGIPDLVVGAYMEVRPNVYGRVRAFSGRDGSVLWDYDATSQSDPFWPWPMINLGVQPGSPYPVVAFRDNAYNSFSAPQSIGRVIALRTALPGAGPVTGSPCSSNGTAPLVGMRLRPGGSRITIAKGPPGGIGWLVGGPAAQTNYGASQLPIALDAYGLPGCQLLVAPVVQVPIVLGSSGLDRGYAAVDLPWAALSTTGTAFAAQWIVLDSTTSAFAATARHEFRIP